MRILSGVSEAELHAYVDGQLSEDRAREVAVWLGEHPAEGVRVGGWRAQNEAIRRAFPPPIRERLTAAFRAEVEEPPQRAIVAPVAPRIDSYRARRRRRRMLATALAFLVGALTAGVAGLLIQRLGGDARRPVAAPVEIATPQTQDFAEFALAAWRAYAEDRQRPVEMTARDRAALANWLSERTGLAHPPESVGARLIGGRVLPGRDANAAFLLYETGDGERLALVAQRSAGAAPGVGQSMDGLRAIAWRTGAFDYALAGKLADTRFRTFAEGFRDSSARTP